MQELIEYKPQGELVYNPDFFRHNIKYAQFNSAENTISQLLAELDIPEYKQSYLNVSIGGVFIPKEHWDRIKPKDTHVLVTVAARGGGGGGVKSILRIVAIVAVAIFAPYAVGLFAPALTGVGLAIATAAVTIAGTLLINAVFPPPSIGNQGTSSNEAAESPSLTLQGQRNTVAPGSPVIRVYGRRRIWPKNAATPFIQTRGDTQYLYMILDFGYGNLILQDEQIGETPLSQFADVQYKVHRNVTNPPFKYFTKNIFTEPLAITLEQGVEHIRTSQLSSKGVQIDFTFPGGLANINDSGNRENQRIRFTVRYRKVGDATWIGYSKATPAYSRRVTASNGSINRWPINVNPFFAETSPDLQGVTFDMAGVAQTSFDDTTLITVLGDNLEDYPDHVPQYQTDQKQGYRAGTTQITIDTSNVLTSEAFFILNGIEYNFVNGAPIGTSVVEISPPLEQDLITSAFEYERPDPSNLMRSSRALFNYRYGGYVYYQSAFTLEVTEATTEPFTLQVDLNFPTVDQWEVSITRVTAVSTSTRVIDTVLWSTLRSIRDTPSVNFDVPHTIVELKIKATDQLQGVVDTFSAIATSVLPTYSGGVAQAPVPTRNPAWHAMDVLTGQSNPTPLPLSKIDVVKFEAWASFCATINPNYAESNLLSDFVIDFNSTIFQLLKTIMGFGRASLSPSDGKYSVIFDAQPTVPVQMFTSHNSRNFTASKSLITPPSAIKVSFIDPDSNWQLRDIIVDTGPAVNGAFEDESFDRGFDLSSVEQTTQNIEYQKIALIGVTRQTQAWRDGRYFLAEAILREYNLTMDVDIENIVCERGDLVRVQQDVVRIGGLPGRIKTVNGVVITVTEPIDFQGVPGNYQLVIRQTDNQIVTYTPVSQSDLFTITLTPGSYLAGDLYTWGLTDQVTDDFIVKEIMPKNDLQASISLIPLAPAVYTSDTGVIPPYVPSLSPDLFQPPPVLAEVSADFFYEYPNRYPQITMTVRWDTNDSAVSESYEVYRYLDNRWKLIALTDGNFYKYYDDILIFNDTGVNILNEDHIFIVVPVGPTGLKHEMDKHPQAIVTPIPDTLTPPPPSDFDLDVVGTSIQLSWVPQDNVVADIKNPGIIGYVMRFNPRTISEGGATWENSTFLTSANFDQSTVTVNARIGSYYIKTINVWNLFSVTSLLAGTTIPEIEGLFKFETIDESPLWEGLKIDCVVDGTDIVNEEISPGVFAQLSYYEFDTQVDMGAIFTQRVDSFITATGSSALLIEDWPLLSAIPLMSPATEADWTVDLQVSYDDAVNWKTFSSADITGQIFRFRLRMRSFRDRTDVRIRVSDAIIENNLKERLDSDNDIQCPAVGLSVLFDPATATVPSITITQDNATAGDYFVRSNVTRTGFDIQFFDVNDVAVARQFDWMARGFGTEAPAIVPPS